jgi:hypothetical protein
MKVMLVYQAGIANVFEVECFNLDPLGRNARRLKQADFRSCENFARGLMAAGVTVRVVACNRAGDIVNAHWTSRLEEQPFSDHFAPVRWLDPDTAELV